MSNGSDTIDVYFLLREQSKVDCPVWWFILFQVFYLMTLSFSMTSGREEKSVGSIPTFPKHLSWSGMDLFQSILPWRELSTWLFLIAQELGRLEYLVSQVPSHIPVTRRSKAVSVTVALGSNLISVDLWF